MPFESMQVYAATTMHAKKSKQMQAYAALHMQAIIFTQTVCIPEITTIIKLVISSVHEACSKQQMPKSKLLHKRVELQQCPNQGIINT